MSNATSEDNNAPSHGRKLKHREIEAGVLKLTEALPIGTKMPTERELSVIYNCSVLTVRRGLQTLVNQGIITRKMGSGTFVAKRSQIPHPSERLLGILVSRQSDAYAHRVIQAIAQAALEHNVQPRLIWVREFDQEAQVQIENLQKEGCSAITIPWFPKEKIDQMRIFLSQCKIPVSVAEIVTGFERYCFEAPQLFGSQTVKMTNLLCQYFHLLGNEYIAFVGPDVPQNVILQRQLAAYASTMTAQSRPLICGLVSTQSQSMDKIASQWERYKGKLAVVSYDDEHALRLVTAMHKIGMTAPHDFRIIGYHNLDACRFSDPPLTTVTQDFTYIANGLIRTALALAKGDTEQYQQPASNILIVRSSCGGGEKITDDLKRQLNGLVINIEREEDSKQAATLEHSP
ncbi:MAG: substrate-binding domain-containing protein [Nibricoccus sp.]